MQCKDQWQGAAHTPRHTPRHTIEMCPALARGVTLTQRGQEGVARLMCLHTAPVATLEKFKVLTNGIPHTRQWRNKARMGHVAKSDQRCQSNNFGGSKGWGKGAKPPSVSRFIFAIQ